MIDKLFTVWYFIERNFINRFRWYRIKRFIKYSFQRVFRGWSDRDLWSLDFTIAKFTLPRLKRFKKRMIGIPMDFTKEEWGEILDMMIYAMESIAQDCAGMDDDIDWEDVQTGLELFGEYFRELWE